MHFDHIVGLPDVWLTGKLWQKESLNVYGAKGTKKFLQWYD
jgi:Metal-dependent hydrolases of the beta-lactamase superfamily III